MATLVSEDVGVQVNVVERSITATANWVFQLTLRVANLRGLPPDYLIGNRKIIEDGLFTWLAEPTLLDLCLEIYDPRQAAALERFDFHFSYRAEMSASIQEPNVARLEEFCRKLHALPPGTAYRILVVLAPGATPVPGWYPAELRPMQVGCEHVLSEHGLGVIGTRLVYCGTASGITRSEDASGGNSSGAL